MSGYTSTDTSCSSGVLVDCIVIYVTVDLYAFVSSNRRATNWRQFCRLLQDTCRRRQADTTCIRQCILNWCKRGISVIFRPLASVITEERFVVDFHVQFTIFVLISFMINQRKRISDAISSYNPDHLYMRSDISHLLSRQTRFSPRNTDRWT